ncbi:MBOAT family O-acyltransferase [Fulvivirgaceae bacterium BMA12]|uniref:MBOAT family O-acyltransferase n=1 Tax=Agaribacillus aureus TaxID=3051825 RepID=A0ABT8LGW7_9BACT|nr:MBOAT family O-acyltransferase [Fulvivirgaceae bacterium BMA12]
MLFNSIEFLLFLPSVFILYWFVFSKNLKHQNLLILVCSYFFYGWWDYRFLSLIFLSTVVDYFVGLKIHTLESSSKRKLYLWISILFNLGILGVFKYYGFFVDSWIELLGSFGYETQSTWTLNIILPVGISFYTFQTLSYSLDIFKGKLVPTKDFISFASFVSFFPQLVAGPIERASNLLPQILNKREFKYEAGIQGLRLILWGMFKKVAIADSLAPMVDDIFGNYQNLGGGTLWLGIFYFSFQIYCDFSGYSDIAIGTSKLFGFDLMSNFKFPYFSRNIGEFWRRWHISLSTWFRDYLYVPLGGSKLTKWISLRNIFIIFTVSGFWHGANWTFIFWGLTHSILYIPFFLLGTNRKYLTSVVAENSFFPSLQELYQMGTTFFFVMISWVFFRSETVTDSFAYIQRMFTTFDLNLIWKKGILYIFVVILIEWFLRKDERTIVLGHRPAWNYLFLLVLLCLNLMCILNIHNNDFIYFQF